MQTSEKISRSKRRREQRKRVVRLERDGAYVPLRQRFLHDDDTRVSLYRVEFWRDGSWRFAGEFGDKDVAANHAQSLRDNLNKDHSSEARTRVVSWRTPGDIGLRAQAVFAAGAAR